MKRIPAIFLALLFSCQAPPAKQQQTSYPDIKSFIQQEVKRLKEAKPLVLKKVGINGKTEQQQTEQINWEQELSLFSESDINKSAYQGLYQLHKKGLEETYTALSPELKTRALTIIKKPNGQIAGLKITNQIANSLYNSSELLSYYPDSVYQIEKKQKVVLLGENSYQVKGSFKK